MIKNYSKLSKNLPRHRISNQRWTVNQYMKEVKRLCQLKNIRFTSLRRAVFEIIFKNGEPIKPYDILEELKKPAYKKVTKPPSVYRCLDYLVAVGVVHRLNSSGAYTYCTHPDLHRECYFLICQKCQQLIECCSLQITDAVNQIIHENNYVNTTVALEIEGICSNCQKKK